MSCQELRTVINGLQDLLAVPDPSEQALQGLAAQLDACAKKTPDDYVCRKCDNLRMELSYFQKLLANPARLQEAEDRRIMLLGEADMLNLHLDG